MPSVMADILDGIVDILEGSNASVDRAPSSGRFRQVTAAGELTGVSAASGSARPFTLEVEDVAEGPDMPANVAGSYVHGAHTVVLTVYYATRRIEMYALIKEILDDEADIRKALDGGSWADAGVTGWTGLEITGSVYELRGNSDPPDLLANVFDMRVDHREDWS